ncbi:MAG: 2-succinyl-6-hydroxy-2,4-cyclohexadiene-1-carboxylate synthase [Chloroflexota bacterium]|nr:2-succinyl-6-hydroxy-2,4-cyclohexadiene-1-carboxylate synthase [Chloroflexota bacterium]
MGELNYTLSGDAGDPAVLFVHGFMGSSEDWQDTIATLDGRYRCLAVDLPGHGDSVGLLPEAYTTEGAVRVVLDLLDELDIGHPAVVGYSMGGRLALYLALRHPERCAGLFLESASPGIEGALERQARREADEGRARRLEKDFETFVAEWYRQPLFASLAGREGLVEKVIEARRRNNPMELARSLRGMGTGCQPSLWGELDALGAPTLAVAGALDEKYARISRRMAELSPRLQTTLVPGAGHNVRLEASEAYLALLQDFLQSL